MRTSGFAVAKKRWRAQLLFLPAACVVFASPGAAAAAAPTPTAPGTCPGTTLRGSAPMPPPGYAVVVDTTVNPDCSVTTSPARMVPLGQMERTDPRLVATVQNAGSVSALSVYGAEATVHQRLWDVANNLLNEFDTDVYWQYNFTSVTYYSAHNYAAYHRELVGGWSLAYQNIWLANGGVGLDHLSIGADAGFSYQGVFDPSGAIFYNTYNNNLTGFRNGSWNCSWSYNWRTGYPGWHTQNWCGNGGV